MTGDRLTVGIVTPHEAAGAEVELPAMTRGGVATVGVPDRVATVRVLGAAADRSPAQLELRTSDEPAASAFAGYVLGHRKDRRRRNASHSAATGRKHDPD